MIDLASLRRAAGITQVQLAETLGMSQGQISRMERQQDMLVSTLASYLAGLAVRAALVIEVGEQTMTYDLTNGQENR